MMRVLLGIVGFFLITCAFILYGSPLSIFIDIPSLLHVLISLFFLSLTKYRVSELMKFSDEVVTSLINFSLISGAIGFLINLIQLLQNMSDPTSIGPAFAVSLLEIFYALILASCFYAIKQGLKSKSIGLVAIGGSLATLLPIFAFIIAFWKVKP